MRRAAILLSLLLLACGGGGANDGGAGLDATLDSGSELDSSPGDAGGDASADAGIPGEPFVAPDDTWTYVEIEGAVCGNGTPLGVAVSLRSSSDRVLLYLQGGGACWDAGTCFALRSASHLEDTLDEATVLSEATSLDPYLFNRDPSVGPFADANIVYVPYCTGDLHAGSNVHTYATATGPREVHHVGADNADLILARLSATVPAPSRVWLAGASAGGYGVTLNFWRARARWPGTRVDVLNDSGPTIDQVAARWTLAVAAWDIQLPPGCDTCSDGYSEILPHYARTISDEYRFGLLGYRQDGVIALYFGHLGPEVERRLDLLRAGTQGTTQQRTFFLDGTQHVVLTDPTRATSGGLRADAWVRQMVTDDPTWAEAGP